MFRQKKIFENPNKTFDVIENKKKAIKLKEMGDNVFKLKRYDVAERFYSEALQLNPGSRPILTNRAICRNTMKKHEDALTDCLSALSIDSKCPKLAFKLMLPKLTVEHELESLFQTITQFLEAINGTMQT